jgi:iron complex transport system substrate-binding protein
MTPAGQHGRIVILEDLYLLGFGPRTGEAARELSELLRQ